jgi:hypothetical protein
MEHDNENDDRLIDERGYTYEYDPATDRIKFIKDSQGYRTLRSAASGTGIDIDKIETETRLYEVQSLLHDRLMAVVVGRIMSRASRSLEYAWLKEVAFGDLEKARELRGKLMRRHKLGLRVVGKDQR